MSSRLHTGACIALTSLCLVSLPKQADAIILSGNAPELVFVLWDSVAKVSYTRDLGLDASSFWLYAQQDSGYSYKYDLDANDAALKAFRAASTTVANQRWAVFAFDSGPTLSPGDTKAYTTLAQGPDGGAVNPNWTDMTTALTGDVLFAARQMPEGLYAGLNFNGTDATQYVRTGGDHATSFDKQASKGYFAGRTGFSAQGGAGDGGYLAGIYNVTNLVNKSSWFYFLTNVANNSTVVVDEFDNLSSNGYWGLALTASNLYSLTFTQAATQSGANSADTDAGRQRMLTTDYAATTGAARWLGEAEPASLALSLTNVSPVPEPSTWGLMGLGLLLIAGRARRQRPRA